MSEKQLGVRASLKKQVGVRPEAQDFNPNHDDHGQFAAGGGGSGSGESGGGSGGSGGASGSGSSQAIPKTIDAPHGTVVVRSKLGTVSIVKSGSGAARYKATRRNGETVGTFGDARRAADALRTPTNPEAWPSGYRTPDVTWKWGQG